MTQAYEIVINLHKILDTVKQGLTKTQVEHVEELIEYGEWSLALETLCDFIHEEKLQISQPIYELLDELGTILKLDSKNWEMLKPFVVNEFSAMIDVQKLTDEFKTILEDATAQDPARQAAARERMNALQKTLQERGVEVGTTLGQLPDLLQFVSQLGEEATVRKLTETLHSFAVQLNQSPEALGRKLDEFIASMERNFGTFVGSNKAREQERIYQEAKASARSAIAESLRAQGITPLTSGENDPAPGEKK